MEAMEVDGEQPIHRKQSNYQNLDEVFLIQNEVYRGQQYSHIYFARLHLMRTLLHSLVPHWKPHIPVCTILGLEEGQECIIVGTLYKHMKLKPCILDEYAKERSATPLVNPHNFMHADDHLVLEDESGRVKLEGTALLPSAYVTGVVVALLGKATGAGSFLVQDFLEAGLPPQIQKLPKLSDDKYVVFVSGLNVGGSTTNPLQFQLLIDHITGHLGDEKNLGSKDQSRLFEPIKELDISLTQIAAGVSLDLMPGANDPANFSLPQQSLNRCLFPGSSVYNTFRSCTNPHFFELDNIRFLGTSGQNIEDLEKYSEAKDKLEFMERTLRWRHIAPTAPNTLGCYPFTDRDPFVLESCPHVYFVGNQDKYESRLIDGPEGQVTQLICIPKFSETGVAVVVRCYHSSFFTNYQKYGNPHCHVKPEESGMPYAQFWDSIQP
ncbi:hypothetical protein Cgig2_031861 [Carnegiea gigantea]|uniref:DNA polymerase delta small subunit n=1 Tax=Carnegiea gigantea TaxID=171969 RepID=A0A9Q1QMX4_9CARY|nr:hypothetical protein Cgig2_031861 [Carnegiea gigantea]